MAHSLWRSESTGLTDSSVEKEVKILWVNYALLVRKLNRLWATKVWSVYIRDWYVAPTWFTWNEKTWKKSNGSSTSVRLRSYGGERFEVTVKSKKLKGEFKEAQEDNIAVPSLEAGKILLEWLWYECSWYKEKIRISYTIEGTFFDIDFYDDIPPVLEIEWTPTSIRKYISELWLSSYKQKTRGARKLLKYYGKPALKMKGSVMGIEM